MMVEYYGIKFHDGFPMPLEQRGHFAMLLFSNPFTTPKEASNIVNSISLWHSQAYLLSALETQLLKVSTGIKKDHKIILKVFYNKMITWVNTFSFPTLEEMNHSSELLNFSPYAKYRVLFEVLNCEKIAPKKIFDFLLKFDTILTEDLKDMLLDTYNHNSYQRTQSGICFYP